MIVGSISFKYASSFNIASSFTFLLSLNNLVSSCLVFDVMFLPNINLLITFILLEYTSIVLGSNGLSRVRCLGINSVVVVVVYLEVF